MALPGIYWGVRGDGQFQYTNYSSTTTSDIPWAFNDSAPNAGTLIESHAGKAITAALYSSGSDDSTISGTTFYTSVNNYLNSTGSFAVWALSATETEMDDLAANSDANGTITDITAIANTIGAYGRPVLFRPLWEMNGNWSWPWQEPQTDNLVYIDAWRTLFNTMSPLAPNLTFAWVPNIKDATVPDPTPWFPGLDYVHWVGFEGYAYTGTYQTPAQRYDETLGILEDLAPGVPVLIGECGANVGMNSPYKSGWITDFLQNWLPNNPIVKCFIWFNQLDGTKHWPFEEGDDSGEYSSESMTAFSTYIASSYYLDDIVDTSTFPDDAQVPEPNVRQLQTLRGGTPGSVPTTSPSEVAAGDTAWYAVTDGGVAGSIEYSIDRPFGSWQNALKYYTRGTSEAERVELDYGVDIGGWHGRFYVNVDWTGTVNGATLIDAKNAPAGTKNWYINLNSSKQLNIRHGGDTSAWTSTDTLLDNVWYRIEVRCKSEGATHKVTATVYEGDSTSAYFTSGEQSVTPQSSTYVCRTVRFGVVNAGTNKPSTLGAVYIAGIRMFDDYAPGALQSDEVAGDAIIAVTTGTRRW